MSVGLGRFELPAFGPPDRRANQPAPQPVRPRLADKPARRRRRGLAGAQMILNSSAMPCTARQPRYTADAATSSQKCHGMRSERASRGESSPVEPDTHAGGSPRAGRRRHRVLRAMLHIRTAARTRAAGVKRRGRQISLAGTAPCHRVNRGNHAARATPRGQRAKRSATPMLTDTAGSQPSERRELPPRPPPTTATDIEPLNSENRRCEPPSTSAGLIGEHAEGMLSLGGSP